MLPDEMMTNVNMLRLGMSHGVVGDLDSTLIVAKEGTFMKLIP